MSATDCAESSASTPAISSMKNGSSARIRDGRAITSPHECARAAESERAARFGYQPSSWAIASTRARVASDTPGCPLRAYETAPFDTPARSAMSAMVALRAGLGSPLMAGPPRGDLTNRTARLRSGSLENARGTEPPAAL